MHKFSSDAYTWLIRIFSYELAIRECVNLKTERYLNLAKTWIRFDRILIHKLFSCLAEYTSNVSPSREIVENLIYERMDSFYVKRFDISFSAFEGSAPIVFLSDLDLLRQILIKDSHVFINRRVNTDISFWALFIIIICHDRCSRAFLVLSNMDLQFWKMNNGRMLDPLFHPRSPRQNLKLYLSTLNMIFIKRIFSHRCMV